MGAPLAFLIFSVGVAGLFYLDRDRSVRTSKALWLPVIWIWIAGSRSFSAWLAAVGIGGGSASSGVLESTLDGSPVDAVVFQGLIIVGLIALWQRKSRAAAMLKVNVPILIYFLYCLISTLWSPFHGPALKRWIKDVGDLVMVLLVVTDTQPIVALRRLYSRVGFVLFPFSIPLIRYTDLGRGFDPDGNPMNTGVTTNKNSLGVIVYLISLGALWNFYALLKDKQAPYRRSRLLAQGTLLMFGVALLQMAHSATSIFCFVLGAGLMLATNLQVVRKRPSRVNAICMGILLAGALTMLSGGQSVVTGALGRKSDLSGRTDIWAASIASADSPVFGTGFESFWNANSVKVAHILSGVGFLYMPDLVSAHNGYLQVYLDLGWVGVFLISFILIQGYLSASKAFRRNRELGSLLLAYIVTGAFYNITEAGFRLLSPSWIFLLLAVVGSSGVAAGLVGDQRRDAVGAAATRALATIHSSGEATPSFIGA